MEEYKNNLLEFWFGLTNPQWFKGGEEVDNMIRERFESDLERIRNGEYDGLHDIDAKSSLALIIGMDQFPRNLARGTPEAFSLDKKARDFCVDGIDKGYLDQLENKNEIMFYTLPLMHQENLEDQQMLLDILKEREMPNIDFSKSHLDTIAEFGRFPYRNEVLGRESTEEEIEFLKKGNFP